MSVFTEGEIAYLNSQKLGRVATIDRKGELHVVPVSFCYNAETDTVDIGGYNIGRSKKFRDAAATGRIAFVVDDILPPSQPRGVEVRGRAETLISGSETVDENAHAALIRITPTRIIGWGIDTSGTARNFQPNSRNVT